MDKIRTGLTFSDVLLVPKRTPLSSRSEADTKTKITKNISLNNPLVSSNMATVTEHKMAIAMAREGGIGVIHQFETIESQVAEVKKVKRSTSYIIEDPITAPSNLTLNDAEDLMARERVNSLLIVEDEKLIGILTHRDYVFETNKEQKISNLMTKEENLIAADPKITLEAAKEALHQNKIEKIPLISKGKLVGLITAKDIQVSEHWPNASRDKKGRLRVAAAVGVRDTLERATALVKAGVDLIVLDVAHAHSDFVIKQLKKIKSKLNVDVLVGNIATKTAAKDLIKAGADGLKVGIGPSPVCTTRIISGSGIPQLTAIMDVVSVAHKNKVPVCADGGMTYPGDISKAIAAGADTICSGSFFAGTDEAPGYIIMKDGKRYKRYIGSASYDSNHERKEKLTKKRYKNKIDVFVEGVANLVDYKGPVDEIIKSLIKGLQSGISYTGAKNIKEMQKNSEFIRLTASGWQESISRGKKLSE